MTDLFLTVLTVSASVSLIVILVLIVSPLLNRRYAAKWKYLIWIFLALRLLVLFNGAEGRSVMDTVLGWKAHLTEQSGADAAAKGAEDEKDGADMAQAEPAPGWIVVELPAQMTTPLAPQAEEGVTFLDVTAVIWLAGCVLFMAAHIISYLHYRRRVMKNGKVVKDVFVLQELLRIKRELHVKHTLPVIVFSGAASPMIMGFLKPVLILPEDDYSGEELYFILKHELIHLKRGDIWFKLLFMAAAAVHWFNPLIWLMQKEAVVDMELSCDEKVTQGADFATKKAYTETLLSTLHKGCRQKTVLSTGFYGGKQVMKKRFQNILRKTGKKNGCYVLVCAAVLAVCAGTLAGCSLTKENADEKPDTEITEEESGGAAFAEMAGSWIIDFDRTDPTIWGTGISFGDSMEIENTGAFSYYIGIGVGGTGICEERDGMFTVEVEPYEEHSPEQEILALQYENSDGAEYIVMDWHGETVYWKRGTLPDAGAPGEDSSADGEMSGDVIILTIMKEGEAEEKRAVLVREDRYAFYLPEGEWQKEEADAWQAVVNEDVRLSVAHFGSDYGIEEILENDGYVQSEEGMLREENGISYHVRFHEIGDEVWCVFYSYPAEAEEGWGRELPVIADTFMAVLPGEYITETAAVSGQVLGYVTDFGGGLVTIDRQDWVVPESEDWKPEYDADAGFEIVDLEGADAVYPVRSDCKYFILENHQGESLELDVDAFERYLADTEFPIFWAVELEDGEAVSFAEWYRP